MSVYLRFSDRVTYFVLLSSIFICFLASITIWSIYIYANYALWINITECSINSDFDCLLDTISNKEVANNFMAELIALNISMIGMFLTAILITLYKFKYK